MRKKILYDDLTVSCPYFFVLVLIYILTDATFAQLIMHDPLII
jgi:hypothetical protein